MKLIEFANETTERVECRTLTGYVLEFPGRTMLSHIVVQDDEEELQLFKKVECLDLEDFIFYGVIPLKITTVEEGSTKIRTVECGIDSQKAKLIKTSHAPGEHFIIDLSDATGGKRSNEHMLELIETVKSTVKEYGFKLFRCGSETI